MLEAKDDEIFSASYEFFIVNVNSARKLYTKKCLTTRYVLSFSFLSLFYSVQREECNGKKA
jgi:hypothetical protein